MKSLTHSSILKACPSKPYIYFSKLALSLSLSAIALIYTGVASMDICYDLMYVIKMIFDAGMWVFNRNEAIFN